jgi:hypothetical protein
LICLQVVPDVQRAGSSVVQASQSKENWQKNKDKIVFATFEKQIFGQKSSN